MSLSSKPSPGRPNRLPGTQVSLDETDPATFEHIRKAVQSLLEKKEGAPSQEMLIENTRKTYQGLIDRLKFRGVTSSNLNNTIDTGRENRDIPEHPPSIKQSHNGSPQSEGDETIGSHQRIVQFIKSAPRRIRESIEGMKDWLFPALRKEYFKNYGDVYTDIYRFSKKNNLKMDDLLPIYSIDANPEYLDLYIHAGGKIITWRDYVLSASRWVGLREKGISRILNGIDKLGNLEHKLAPEAKRDAEKRVDNEGF